MLIAAVDIAGLEMLVEYDFDITLSGNSGAAASLSYAGDPPEPAEFNIDVLGLKFVNQAADVPDPEMPGWLKDVLTTHLSERDDVNDVVQSADQERGYDSYED